MPLLCEILGNKCITVVYYSMCIVGGDVINFEINLLYCSNPAVFSAWPKTQDKNLNILRTKKAFKMK